MFIYVRCNIRSNIANELIPLIVDDMHKSTINYTRINTPTSTEKAFTRLNNVKSDDEDDIDEVLM